MLRDRVGTKIRVQRVLDYFDGPLVLESRDDIGAHYVGVRIPDGFPGDLVLVGVKPKALKDFAGGDIDLLTLMQERPGGWYYGFFGQDETESLLLGEYNDVPIPDECLPGPGYLMYDPIEDVEWLVKQARKDHSLVLAVTVAPSESLSDEVCIQAKSLGKLLTGIQSLLEHAYGRFARDARKAAIKDGHIFNVRELRPGSLQIVLEPSERQNLFGAFEGMPAMNIIGRLFANPDDPEGTVAMISKEYPGHLASAYRNLLDTLIEQNTSVEIAWADPSNDVATTRRMTVSEAKLIRTQLGITRAVTEETKVLMGRLVETNIRSGSWRLEGSDKKDFSGTTAEGGKSMKEIVMDVDYRFVCTAQMNVSATGTETTEYAMSTYERV